MVSDFAFDDRVADVFSDMLNRSIPGYSSIIRQVGSFAKRYVKANTHIYDLGCSNGATTLAIRHAVPYKDCRIISVDNSPSMVRKMKSTLERDISVVPVEIRCEDVCETQMSRASFAAMNFTLQFIGKEQKSQLVQSIYNSLLPGGALMLSEKVQFAEADEQAYVEQLYFDFKRHNGYGDLEISQKRDALENVLSLESPQQHLQRLNDVGFSSILIWFKCLNFVSFLCVK